LLGGFQTDMCVLINKTLPVGFYLRFGCSYCRMIAVRFYDMRRDSAGSQGAIDLLDKCVFVGSRNVTYYM